MVQVLCASRLPCHQQSHQRCLHRGKSPAPKHREQRIPDFQEGEVHFEMEEIKGF